MKLIKTNLKTILLLSFTFLGMIATQAQVTFKPGIRAGANFSHFTKGNDYYNDYNDNDSNDYDRADFSSKTGFYVGFYGALRLGKVYTMQPELDYSAQGTSYRLPNNKAGQFDVDYLSFALINKFTFGERFNFHVGPTLDFLTSKNFRTETNFDMAFVAGFGVNLLPNLGIEARVKKGIIPVIYQDFFDSYHTNVVFSVGATYTFDIKK